MIKNLHLLHLFLILIFVSGCHQDRVFEKNVTFDAREWTKDKSVSFRFEISDIHSGYNFYYNLRNSILYPYQNIYLSFSLEDTLGNVYQSDLANINLFDSKTGRPLGSGMGDIFDHQYRIIEDYSFNNPGIYEFNINHYMRPDTLREIMAVGLRIEKVPEQ